MRIQLLLLALLLWAVNGKVVAPHRVPLASGGGGDGAAARVRAAFLHAWRGYERHAFGHDEVRPTTNATNDSWGGFGVTLIDGLDTALLMGLDDVVAKSVEHVSRIDFATDWFASTFEYTIRYLGGLLSAYAISREPILLAKAREIGERLFPAFHSPSGIPYGNVNLLSGAVRSPGWLNGRAILAEAGSVQLEFIALSELSGDSKFAESARHAMLTLVNASHGLMGGLFPIYIDIESGVFSRPFSASLGALSDSFYEILFKQWLLEGRDPQSPLLAAWREAWKGIQTRLMRTSRNGHVFVGQIDSFGEFFPEMDHLCCHMPGLLALASVHLPSEADAYLEAAIALADTCWYLYESSATGLGPERVRFHLPTTEGASSKADDELDFTIEDPKYLLRPELLESFFVLWKVTGERRWRERAWKILERIEEHCKTDSAFSALADVNRSRSFINSMQSFFFAETLKYLYLTLSDHVKPELVDLHHHVLTTEAHFVASRKVE